MNIVTSGQPLVGLEMRIVLNTRSKLFSSSASGWCGIANSHIDPTCTGQPGALPLLNGEAVHKAVQFCCAINADIAAASYFVRIYGFSPQSPYNFHISQRHHPLACGGAIGFKVDGEIFTVAISHLFLEEDNAVVINRASYSTVDYNRAGRPLLVIVAATPLPTAQAATAYCMAVGQLARSLGISDCSLEEGACGIDGHMSEGMPLYYNLPEPDLQPIVLSRSYIDAMHKSVAEQLGHR